MNTSSTNGFLQIYVFDNDLKTPIENANINIYLTDSLEPVITDLKTDSSGKTDIITLPTVSYDYSLSPSDIKPFTNYSIQVSSDNYQLTEINDIEIFELQTAIQPVYLSKVTPLSKPETITLPDNTLWGNYPPKIAEDEIKPLQSYGEIVLNKVVIPEYIVVHDGVPKDSNAKNYYVRYTDYIKNVACCEIYSTWPTETIKANILAIMSFTLNRIYTEWYRNQGYNFSITSSTAYDQKWVYEHTIYESISIVVDNIFNNYISKPNVKQPILTQYCDGRRAVCPNWLSQWGSNELGKKGYSALEIIKYYYGNEYYINSAEQINGIPSSFPGENLDIGSSGQKVRQIQEFLNLIGDYYNKIPVLIPDGIYGEKTANAVKEFQKIFKLPANGIVDYPTWYKISDIYVRLSNIAELV